MTGALILAAGRGSRMGRPKGLLPHPPTGRTFLGHLVDCVHSAGLTAVAVVGRSGDEGLRRETEAAGVRFVVNHQPDDGQLSSLLAGLDALDASGVSGLLVLPVDVPHITPGVVDTLLAAAARTPAVIVRAAYGGRHGHPVLFKQAVFDELRRADPSVGARAVVRADPQRVLDVETGDPGVLADVDTPEDYERIFGRTL